MNEELEPQLQRLPASETTLGEGMQIRRALPTRLRRMVGPWCFLDHFGPVDIAHSDGMRVGPHPHIGLQTVTWLYEGEILHRDSLGSVQTIVPGQLNVMTSGRGISHSEESPHPHPARLHGLQFWIALPEAARRTAPAFDHHPVLPVIEQDALRMTLIAGEMYEVRSPAQLYSPAVALDVDVRRGTQHRMALNPAFEYAVLVTVGEVVFEGEALQPGTLLYLGAGRSTLDWTADEAARFVLVGGAPFGETVLMWWNFVARSHEELLNACQEWNAGAPAFGEVQGYDGARLTAPLPPWQS